jgi:uncharacterized protein YjgD (DUF1641 family)
MPGDIAKQFLDKVIAEQMIAGVTGDGDVSFPLDQDQFRDLVNQRRDDRRMNELLENAPGGSLIELLRQRGMLKGV